MIRVARFEVEAARPQARSWLLRRAFVPRSRRERLALRIGDLALRLGLPFPLPRLAPPGACGAAPDHRSSLDAVRSAMDASGSDGAGVEGGLDLLPAPHVAAPLRLLVLWRGEDSEPCAVAKVGRAESKGRLATEAATLRELAGAEKLAGLAPRLLAEELGGSRAVLVQSCLPGPSLARWLAVRAAGAWPAEAFGRLGAQLGACHAGGRLHGDAWSRNVILTDDGRPLGWVDWESSACEGEPAPEALRFLLATARTDLRARSARHGALASDDARLVRWLFGRGPARGAVRAFLAEWRRESGLAAPALATRAPAESLGLQRPPSTEEREILSAALAGEERS